MKTLPFLLEIGTEEIPDWMIQPALKQLGELFEASLKDNKLAGSVTWLEATPRRLALKAEGILARQANSVELVTGPPKSAGEGAAAGFARKLGVEASALTSVKTAKGEYLAFRKKVPGRKAIEILAQALPDLILKIYFPKTMYWNGKGSPRFIRPIRWLVALLGNRVVPFELAGVQVRQPHHRPPAAREEEDSGHHRQLPGGPARELRAGLGRGAQGSHRTRPGRGELGRRAAQHPGLPHRIPYPHHRQLRRAVSGTAPGSPGHRHAAPPAVLLRGDPRLASLRRGSSR